MELLKRLYEISSPSESEQLMREFIVAYCKSLGCKVKVDKTGNVYAKKGKSPSYPCVVAHMDEVCPKRPIGYKVMEVNGRLFGFDTINCYQCGIGGDDKNGIWVALKCLTKYDVMKCAFFVGEERGCIGSSDANMDWFKNCRFVVQCDRRGNSDLVTSISGAMCSEEFIADVNPTAYGYETTEGMLTDVITLKENGLDVSAVNMSCGYYNPHTEHEYTIIDDLYKCLYFVEHIIEDCTKVYTHKFEPIVYTRSAYTGYNYYDFGSKASKKEQLQDLELELLDAIENGYFSCFEEVYQWYHQDYPKLTKQDISDVYYGLLNEQEELYQSMENELRGKLINEPDLDINDIEEEMSNEWGLPVTVIRSAYDDIMS